MAESIKVSDSEYLAGEQLFQAMTAAHAEGRKTLINFPRNLKLIREYLKSQLDLDNPNLMAKVMHSIMAEYQAEKSYHAMIERNRSDLDAMGYVVARHNHVAFKNPLTHIFQCVAMQRARENMTMTNEQMDTKLSEAVRNDVATVMDPSYRLWPRNGETMMGEGGYPQYI